MNGGTVKQFLTALEEMRTVYLFDDEKTSVSINHNPIGREGRLSVSTTDERTGIVIEMSKNIMGEEIRQ